MIPSKTSIRCAPDDLAGRESIPSAIPSNAEIDLMNAGKIGDVYFGNNILSLRGLELYDLWYEISFSLEEKQSAGNPYLVFHGVDTIAEYFLNDVKIGASDNMLVEHAFDIATTAKIGENRLFVHIFSPVRAASKEEYYAYMVAFPLNFASVRLRKAPHMFGWDIMPRLLSGGIWRGAEILFRKDIGIENCYFATLRADTRRATLWFQYSLRCPPELYGKATLRLSAKCGDSEIDYAEKLNFCVSTARIDVADAKLWWVRDYGEPNLYEARVSLISENGEVLDEKQYRFGLRTVEIERSDLAGKENGGRFRVILNGTPVFCKGTNWVPADALHADEERIPAIMDKVRD
ncbi:MAG: glycosyl hydrolase 2 galactose-binding domain-containing protein [Candidatus Borkfalkia sp.]